MAIADSHGDVASHVGYYRDDLGRLLIEIFDSVPGENLLLYVSTFSAKECQRRLKFRHFALTESKIHIISSLRGPFADRRIG